MKYILFEKSAIEELINYRYFQTAEYAQGSNFARFLRNEDTILEPIANVSYKRNDDGIFFIGKEISKTFLFIDVEKSEIFDSVNISETIQIFQKLFRFAVRYWNKQGFTSSEKILENNKAVVFPFSYSSMKTSFRVVIERDPDSKRMATRGMRQLLLVYKSGSDGAPNYVEMPVLKNLRSATEVYNSILAECKKELELTQLSKDVQTPKKPVNFYEINGIINGGNPYMPYEIWDKILTDNQKEFIFHFNNKGPMRLQGPAGTGKTITLILKAIYLLRDAEKKNKECRIIFFAHSKATQLSIKNIFDSISAGKWNQSNGLQNILITTLHEYCIDNVIGNISENEILERDAMDSKQLQYYAICEAYDKILSEYYKTYKPLLSKDLISIIDRNSENKSVICGLLQHEFSVMIKGKASGELERYKKIPPLSAGLYTNNEDDKKFIFKIYNEYQKFFERVQQYDTDDIVLTAIGHLDNPLWRRRRKQDGYDYVFIDETHLFNSNETMIFHYLTKGSERLPIIFSIDISQAIGDQGKEADEFLESYNAGNNIFKREYDLVFRCSSQITDLAMSITASGSSLFGNFRNPYKNATSAFTGHDEAISKFPEYILKDNDNTMVEYALECAEDMATSMHCSPSEIAIISFSENLYVDLTKAIGDRKYIEIKKRGDLEAKNRAGIEKAYILTMPEYVGGLEFFGVILVGVDGAHVPPLSSDDISKNYLLFSAFNKLYVSVTRAKYQVVMLGAKEYGVSPCLEYSIRNNTIKKVEHY